MIVVDLIYVYRIYSSSVYVYVQLDLSSVA